MQAFAQLVHTLSAWALPLALVLVPGYALLRKVDLYAEFVEGAKEGLGVALRIAPYLVAILVAVGAFRGAGAMGQLADGLRPFLEPLGVPTQVLPLMLVRPLSGSGATGLLADLIREEGPDSLPALIGAVMNGSTETTFYVVAVYFGAVGVVRYRHAIAAALCAEAAGFAASVAIVRWLWG